MKRLYIALATVAVALLALAAGIGWLLGTESGLRWAAARAGEAIEFEGLRGRLAGEIAADRLAYRGDGLRVEARGVRVRTHLAALLGGRLTIDPLHVGALEVELQETGRQTTGKPELPLRLHVANAAIDKLALRRGDTTILLEEARLEHATLGEDVSAAGSFHWPHERFATRAKFQLRGSLERLEAGMSGTVAEIPAEARALLRPYDEQRVEAFEARFGPVDLARFHDAAPQTALQATLKGESSAGGALRGSVTLVNANAGALDAGRLPVERLEAGFLTDLASARLDRLGLVLPGGGRVTGEAELQADRVQAKLVAARVDLRALHTRLRRTGLYGPLQVLLDRERLVARGSLTQEGIGFTAEVERIGQTIRVRELRALAEGGELSGTGTVRLGGATEFDAELAIRNFNPAAFGDYPRGSLSGQVDAAGRLEPRDVELRWRLEKGVLYGHAFQSEGSARLLGERVTRANAEVRLGANRLTARGAYGRPGDQLAVTLDAPRLEEFAPIGGRLRARGTLAGSLDNPRAALSGEAQDLALPGGVVLQTVTAKLSGTLSAHDLALTVAAPSVALDLAADLRGGWRASRGWTGEIRSARNAGAYPLQLAAPAPLSVAPRRLAVGRLDARLDTGRVLVREATWSPGQLASSGEFTGLPAQWLVAAAGLGERLHATLLLDGEWQLARAQAIDGWARVRRSGGDVAISGNALGIESGTLEAKFERGRASARGAVVAKLARLAFEGDVLPSLDLRGKIEFAELRRIAGAFAADTRLDGQLEAELRATGSLASPELHGTLVARSLAFEYPPYGIALKDGSLIGALDGRSLRIESFAVRAGEGRLLASGVLPLGPEGTANLAWSADKLTLLDRPDMRLVLSGKGEASYDGERASLAGELRADRGHFEFARDRLPTLGDDVVIVGGAKPPATPPLKARRLPVALDLQLDMGDQLVVQGYGYDGKVAGRLEVTTTQEGELRAYGRLHAVNATFLAYGQRLDVDPGLLIFDGPIDNPSLQITAWRRNQAVEAGVQMTGTARAPIMQLVSQPPVPEGERLSWLVLGRPPAGASQADLGLLQAAAGALLAGGDSVPLDRRIARRFGLDELSLRGSGEATERVVAIGKRLSDRLYVSYEQGLGAVASNLIKLDYALGRRWTLRAETGSSSGGGLFYRYSWD